MVYGQMTHSPSGVRLVIILDIGQAMLSLGQVPGNIYRRALVAALSDSGLQGLIVT